MRVPISWLKEYVDVVLPVGELAERLTLAGLEVAEIEYIGIPGGSDTERLVWDREKLVMGQILAVNPHPDADRLILATVVLSLGAGVAASFAASQAFPTISTANQLRAVAQMAVLGSISYRPTPAALRRGKRNNYVFAGGVTGLCALFGMALTVLFVAARIG